MLLFRCLLVVQRERIVAVALLTQSELQGVGDALRCILPIADLPNDFTELLAQIDEAEEASEAKAAGA